MSKDEIKKIIELSFVIVVTISMVLYGIGKPLQFLNSSSNNKPVPELTGMELMWAFYGYSKTYPILLGIAEITGALLLIIRKTRIIGGLILSGILLNVITQDIIYNVNKGALNAAIIYQFMIFVILWFNKTYFWNGLKAMYINPLKDENKARNRLIIFISLVLVILLKIIEQFITH